MGNGDCIGNAVVSCGGAGSGEAEEVTEEGEGDDT